MNKPASFRGFSMLNRFISLCLVTSPSMSCAVLSHSVCPTLPSHGLAAHVCKPLSVIILQARILEWFPMPSSRGYSQPRDQTQVSHTAGRFFISWATRGTKNTGVGSLSLFQQIFLTQELNQGLLYCRQILYQLSCQGSPISYIGIIYAYEKLDSKVFASVKSHEGFTDLAYTLLPIFPWFWNISKQKWKLLSCVRLFEIPWTIKSMGFSRQEYWNG